jgi:hypothetical protein
MDASIDARSREPGCFMIRFAALLVAASMLAVSIPAAADGIPRKKRPVVTKEIKEEDPIRGRVVIERETVVEEKQVPPPVVAASPSPLPLPALPPPVFVWMPGHWTWNAPINMHVWVPGMYIRSGFPACTSARPRPKKSKASRCGGSASGSALAARTDRAASAPVRA